MIDLSINDSDLSRQLQKLPQTDRIIGEEFGKAEVRTLKTIVRDLRAGVAQVSGDLRSAITGEVKSVVGAEVTSVIGAQASHGGYAYGGRLDRDGKLRWRSGKYKDERTWGWFSYVGPRIAQRYTKRSYQSALDKAVQRLVTK